MYIIKKNTLISTIVCYSYLFIAIASHKKQCITAYTTVPYKCAPTQQKFAKPALVSDRRAHLFTLSLTLYALMTLYTFRSCHTQLR